jgi:hypothetical protein
MKCIGLDFGKLEFHIVRAILVVYSRERTIVLTGSLSSQWESEHIVGGATQVIELVACLNVDLDWLTGSLALQNSCKVWFYDGCCRWRGHDNRETDSGRERFFSKNDFGAVTTHDKKSGAPFKDTKGIVVWNSSGHILSSRVSD